MQQGDLTGVPGGPAEATHPGDTHGHDDRDRVWLPVRPPVVSRVLVVDDHRIFADLLAYSIDAQDDFVCVGRASTVAEAISLTDALAPEIVLMDIGLPDGDGVEATARIMERHPNVRVLILTGTVDQNLFARAARAGAIAFLGKYDPLDDVLATLRGARAGAVIINNTLLSLLTSPTPDGQPPAGDEPDLTARERDVLGLLAKGHDVHKIARALSLPVSNCRGQVRSLRKKLGAHSQLEVVVKAGRAGLLPAASAEPAGAVPVPHGAPGAGTAPRPVSSP